MSLTEIVLSKFLSLIDLISFEYWFLTLIVPFSYSDASYSIQLLGVVSICLFVFIFSYAVIFILKSSMGLRISEEAEKLGTDKAEIGVIAYSIRD